MSNLHYPTLILLSGDLHVIMNALQALQKVYGYAGILHLAKKLHNPRVNLECKNFDAAFQHFTLVHRGFFSALLRSFLHSNQHLISTPVPTDEILEMLMEWLTGQREKAEKLRDEVFLYYTDFVMNHGATIAVAQAAIRNNDPDLYFDCLKRLLPLFFATNKQNYVIHLLDHISDTFNLSDYHRKIATDNRFVSLTGRVGHSIAADHAIETHYNRVFAQLLGPGTVSKQTADRISSCMSILEAIHQTGEEELGSRANGNGQHTSSSVDNELRVVEQFAVDNNLFKIKVARKLVDKLLEFETKDHVGLFQKSYSFYNSRGSKEYEQILDLYLQNPGRTHSLFKRYTSTLREEKANQQLVENFFCMESGCASGIFSDKPISGWKRWGNCRNHYRDFHPGVEVKEQQDWKDRAQILLQDVSIMLDGQEQAILLAHNLLDAPTYDTSQPNQYEDEEDNTPVDVPAPQGISIPGPSSQGSTGQQCKRKVPHTQPPSPLQDPTKRQKRK